MEPSEKSEIGTHDSAQRPFDLPTRREYQAEHGHAEEIPKKTITRTVLAVNSTGDVPSCKVIISAIALTIIVLCAILTLVASYSMKHTPDTASTQSGNILTAFDTLSVSGRVGATPVVQVHQPVTVAGVKERVYVEGEGRTITEESPILVAITAFDGNTGQVLNPSGHPRLQVGYANESNFRPELLKAVIGHQEGSRIVVIRRLAPDAIAPGATSEFEIDVIDILPSLVKGQEVLGANGTPLKVEIAENGPRISHTGEAPSGLKTQLLIKGDGEQVREQDNVVAQFILANWTDGIVKDSTWDRGLPQLIDLSTAMPGLVEALTDQRVGSRIAAVIPPDKASGEDTLVAVIDILGSTSAGSDIAQSDSAQSVK